MLELHELAKKHGGKCLAKKYINNKQKIPWECSKGHVFKMRVDSVVSGQLCGTCYRLDRIGTKRGKYKR